MKCYVPSILLYQILTLFHIASELPFLENKISQIELSLPIYNTSFLSLLSSKKALNHEQLYIFAPYL